MRWWVVGYYEVYGRTGSAEQYMTVQGPTQSAAIAAAQAELGSHATGVGELIRGPYTTQADAQAALSTTQQQSAAGQLNPTGGPAGQPDNFPNPLGGLAAIGDFFGRLTEGSTWIRFAEGLLGLGLIVVGLARLASGTSAGKAAIKAGKAAAIL